MVTYRQIVLLISLTVLGQLVYAQQRGEILKSGDNVLDPNGDGFITASGGPFSIDGYYVDEFELKMFGIPIVGDGDVSGDVQAGASCGVTDLVPDTAGYSAYGVLEAGNLIFRFRIGDDKPSVQAYSILIDTDSKLGTSDLNATGDNPGFEVLITLIKNNNKGLYIYNVDGIDGCPTPLETYPFATHFQSSVAGTTSCDDADYFYDFYVPFQIMNDLFGITAQSELRFVAVTNVSATCAFGGTISDVGGVDDDEYTSLVDMFTSLSESQCPTAIEDLCQTCEGFASGTTDKPIINQPVKVGENVITGTSELEANIFLSVFDDGGSLIEDITGLADINGDWEITLSNPLADGDSITARAQIEGGCSSGISESDLSYAVVIFNTPAVVSGNTSTLGYVENGDPLSIFDDLSISDIDDTEMDSAWLTFTVNYNAAEDVITLPPGQGLNISWESSMNRVRIYGQASLAAYQSVIRGISYSNTSEDPDVSTRAFSIQLHDGLDPSNTLSRSLDITPTNDAPELAGDAITIGYTEDDVDTLIDNTITISDIDDTLLEGAIIGFTSGYNDMEDTLQFSDQNGISGSFDDALGVLTLTGTATIAEYQNALRSIKYENLDAGNDPIGIIDDETTRIIYFQVDDGDELSNIHSVSIDISISPNVAPVFVDNITDQNPVDTVKIDLLEDTVLDTCLAAIDPDGDLVVLQTGFTYEIGEGIAVLTGGLCFTFTPNENYEGSEYISFDGCDNATVGSLCDDVVVEINIIPVNDPPDIVDEFDNPIDTVNYATNEDTPANFCIDAIDIENNTLEFTDAISTSGNGTPIIGDASILCFDFTPDPDFYGYDTLQLVVCEQGSTTQCDTIIAIVEVTPANDPPVIQLSGVPVDTIYFDALEDIITQMCVSAVDPDMDALQVVEANLNEGPGIFEPNPLGDLCWFFQSLKDSTGMVYGEIIVCDDASPSLCDTIIAAVNVIPVNDPPIIVDEDDEPLFEPFDTLYFTIDEDEPLNFCINATDPDGDPIVLSDAVSLDGNGSYVITNPNNLCVTYTPDTDYNGTDQGVLTVCESSGTDPQCASIVVDIEIIPVNDPPSITNGGVPVDTLYYTTDEDNPIDICLIADDVDGNPISLDEVTTTSSDGIFDLGDPGDLCITFVPNENFNGEVAGKVIICDNQSPALCDTVVIIIDVTPVNDPPDIIDENMVPVTNDTLFFEINEDEPLSSCLIATDPDDDPLELTQITSNDGNGSYVITDPGGLCFDYTPDPDFNGQDIGEATVCEVGGGLCSSTVIVINILPVNDPPVITVNGNPVDTAYFTTDEDLPATFCIGGGDVDNSDVITISSINTSSTDALFTPDQTDLCFDFVPADDYFGSITAEVIVCDDQNPALCDTIVVIVDVLPVNDPPVFIHDNIVSDTLIITTQEDTPVEFCFDKADPENQSVTDPVIMSSTNLGEFEFTQGTLDCYLFTPLSEANGIEYATISVCDDQNLCSELVVGIIIQYVNDAPFGANDTYEHDIYTSFTGNLTDNDSDLEGTRLNVTIADGSQLHGQLELETDGSFKYTPSRGFVGTEVFTYLLCDTGEDPQCVTVTVTFELNDPLIVWQAVSPNGDGMNDFWVIDGIDLFPDNRIQIFDRYSNLVYEVDGYNNQDKVWSGQSNRGLFSDTAVDGTYFYKIDLGDEKIGKPLSGFIILKIN